MTTGIIAHRSEAVGHDGFAQLLRAEWTKFRTVRGWMIALGAAALVVVLLSFVSASGNRPLFCPTGPSSCTSRHPAVPTGPGVRREVALDGDLVEAGGSHARVSVVAPGREVRGGSDE